MRQRTPLVLALLRTVCEAFVATAFVVPLFAAAAAARLLRAKRERPRLFWGPVPIISNSYWSRAMRRAGYDSTSFMEGCYTAINRRSDYDRYLEDLAPIACRTIGSRAAAVVLRYFAFLQCLARYDVHHLFFSGGFLGRTPLWRLEALLLRIAGCRTVVTSYGADSYCYSRIVDPCVRHVMLVSYPGLALTETLTRCRVDYWTRHADAVVTGIMTADGFGRWDALPVSPVMIDCDRWRPRESRQVADGVNGAVKVVHTPNHRGFKGTEFLIRAVGDLQKEGLSIELILLEKRPNEEVRRILHEEADILAEQFIAHGYAMSAMEGMASGLPVLANLDDETYTRVLRRYSWLDECPILSTTPETLKANLRILVTNPALRETLGRAGRQYVEKYHSDETAVYLFEQIYRRIWHGEDVALNMLFHPLMSEYCRRTPRIEHPLVENRLPPERAASAVDAPEPRRSAA